VKNVLVARLGDDFFGEKTYAYTVANGSVYTGHYLGDCYQLPVVGKPTAILVGGHNYTNLYRNFTVELPLSSRTALGRLSAYLLTFALLYLVVSPAVYFSGRKFNLRRRKEDTTKPEDVE